MFEQDIKNNLYIVESPTKANHLKKFNVKTLYTLGHISEIDITNFLENKEDIKFIPKKQNIQFIEKTIKNFNGNIVIGTDPDVEGETIAASVAEIAKRYNKPIIRNPLYGLSNKHLENFVFLKNVISINQNKIKSSISRMFVDQLLSQNMFNTINNKLGKAITLGRVQHTILLLLEQFDDIHMYNIDTYKFMCPKQYKKCKIEQSLPMYINMPLPYNTNTLLQDCLQSLPYNLGIQDITRYIQKLYMDKTLNYPRTKGIVLEEDFYNMLFYKTTQLNYPISNKIIIDNYENAISILDSDYFGKTKHEHLLQILHLILRRSMLSLLDNMSIKTKNYKLYFEDKTESSFKLCCSDNSIFEDIYKPDYVISELESIEPNYLGSGIGELEILKLLQNYQIGQASTIPKILDILYTKRLIIKNSLNVVSITNLGKHILNIINQTFPFLTLEYYSLIQQDFNHISKDLQNWQYPILKIRQSLKENNINTDPIDFNIIHEETEYKGLWFDDEYDELISSINSTNFINKSKSIIKTGNVKTKSNIEKPNF